MDRSNVINLIKQIRTQDEILQWTSTETSRQVFCDVRSITQTEWFEAGRLGIKPSFIFVMNRNEYEGEEIVEFEGKRYGVYRTYATRNESIELYCETKGGVIHEQTSEA